jgi:hypothetical protein
MKLFKAASEQHALSPRACHRILKVARTLAGMDDTNNIATEHLAEAISYRTADRKRPLNHAAWHRVWIKGGQSRRVKSSVLILFRTIQTGQNIYLIFGEFRISAVTHPANQLLQPFRNAITGLI